MTKVRIGLEIHVQLDTETKLFCSCPARFGGGPNRRVCPICLGLPGTMPALQQKALDLAVKTALMLRSTINSPISFDRKHYFYPDLPKGYQITQFRCPLGTGGTLKAGIEGREIPLERVHLEEDAGKSFHLKEGVTAIDFNRAGIPLVEIVTMPEIRTSTEAHEFLVYLKQSLKYAGVSDCSMEQGNLRCDVNISLDSEDGPGPKTEIKNLNSFRGVREAIDFEIKRQKALRPHIPGGETRLWDQQRGQTFPMRVKEELHDYRYCPEPDIPLMTLPADYRDAVEKKLPEMPDKRHRRFTEEYALSSYEASVITACKERADFFEKAIPDRNCGKETAKWVMGPLLAAAHDEGGKEIYGVSPEDIKVLITAVEKEEITFSLARDLFKELLYTGETAKKLLEIKSSTVIKDPAIIEEKIKKIIDEHSITLRDYQKNKKKANFIIGNVMKETKGRADPQIIRKVLDSLFKP